MCKCETEAFPARLDYAVTFPIKKIIKENAGAKTIFLDVGIYSKPGQFVMVWLPQVDEKPFTVSYSGNGLGITVQEKGIFTKQILNLKKGDLIGVRGPYGNSFSTDEVKKVCIVAGGLGIATLNMLVRELLNKKAKVKLILGAQTKNKLLYVKELEKLLGKDLYIITDDGSAGEKGFATHLLEKFLEKEKFDLVYGCGPEMMMVKVFQICREHRVKCELSLERYMKCGFGVCGQCAIDDKLVCKDGTVFRSESLCELKEFGAHCRLKSGKKVSLEEFVKHRSENKN